MQDLRITKTKKALYEAFTRLMRTMNFDDLTVSQLCEEAMVRRATFYSHYCDIYDFFEKFLYYKQSKFEQEHHLSEYSGDHYFLVLLEETIDSFENNSDVLAHIASSSVYLHLMEILYDMIKEDCLKYIEKLQINVDISTSHMACFFAGGMIQLLGRVINPKYHEQKDEIINDVAKLIDLLKRTFIHVHISDMGVDECPLTDSEYKTEQPSGRFRLPSQQSSCCSRTEASSSIS